MPNDPAMKQFIADHWDLVETSGWDSNMLFDSDAGVDIFTIFIGTLAEIGIAGVVVYLMG